MANETASAKNHEPEAHEGNGALETDPATPRRADLKAERHPQSDQPHPQKEGRVDESCQDEKERRLDERHHRMARMHVVHCCQESRDRKRRHSSERETDAAERGEVSFLRTVEID